MLCGLGFGIGAACRNSNGCRQSGWRWGSARCRPLRVPPPVQQEAEKYAYILGEYGGRLAVYRAGEQEPATVLDVYLGLLPPADAQALRQGIPVEDRAELERRLEDYSAEGLSPDCNRFFIKKG